MALLLSYHIWTCLFQQNEVTDNAHNRGLFLFCGSTNMSAGLCQFVYFSSQFFNKFYFRQFLIKCESAVSYLKYYICKISMFKLINSIVSRSCENNVLTFTKKQML